MLELLAPVRRVSAAPRVFNFRRSEVPQRFLAVAFEEAEETCAMAAGSDGDRLQRDDTAGREGSTPARNVLELPSHLDHEGS